MSRETDERIAALEAEVARLKLQRPRPLPMPRLGRRLALLALAVALVIPAGVLASHRFNDVPTNHQFHAAISAIADAGITSGCPQGTNNYCPDGLITRGQMAAFLSRLGALQPGSPPKVNADRVDGRHANQLVRVASMQATGSVVLSNGPLGGFGTFRQHGPDLVITAPAAGFVTVNIGFTVSSSCNGSGCYIRGRVLHVQSGLASVESEVFATSEVPRASGSVHKVFTVNQGVNTFRLQLRRFGDSGTINATLGTGTALYTPFGSTGGSTLSLDGE